MSRLDTLNARVGARRSRLLGPAGLRALAADGSLETRLERLRRGPWAEALPLAPSAGRAAAAPSSAAIEAGLRGALRREAKRLLELAEGARARAVLAAFLALDEADAVKALLRGVAGGVALERILSAAPAAPGLPEPLLREAASAPTVEAAVARLQAARHPLGEALAEALARPPGQAPELRSLEAAVDRAAAARALEAARRGGEDGAVLAEQLADRADARHAALLLALAGAGPRPAASLEPLCLEGARRLPPAEVARLAGADPEVVRQALRAAFVDAPWLATPWGADLALEGRRVRRARRAARARPLSVAVPMAYLLERRAEARRIAVLLRGAELALPADEVLSLLET